MDWDRAINLTSSREMQKSLLHMKTVANPFCYNDHIINNLVLKVHKKIISNATDEDAPKEGSMEAREINLKRNIYEEKIINQKNQLRNKQQLSSAIERKLSSYRSELKNLASRANKCVRDKKEIDNTYSLFNQKLKTLKRESSEIVNFYEYSSNLLKQLENPNSVTKEGTVITLKKCCNIMKSNKSLEFDTEQLAESIENLTQQFTLMQLLQGEIFLLKQYFCEMTNILTGVEVTKKETESEKELKNHEANLNLVKMKCIHHHIERKSLELKVLKHRHNLMEISNQILSLITENTPSDREHTIKSWLTLNFRNEVSNAMKMACEEHLSSAAVTKVDVDFLKLKLLAAEKTVVDIHSECDFIKQNVTQDLKSIFKSFCINLDTISRLYKGKISELINLDNSLKTTKEILTNNKDKHLFEFGLPFSSLTVSTKNYQHQFLEDYSVGNSIPLYSAHCTALNIINMKHLFSYLYKEQPMSVISLFKNITLPSNNKDEAFKAFVLQMKTLINTIEEVKVKSIQLFSVLWEHPFSDGLPEQMLVKSLTPKQWMVHYSVCLRNIQ